MQSWKVISESDILSVLSVLTREGQDSSWQIPTGDVGSAFERVFERSRLFEVLNDVAFRVEGPDDDGSRGQNREREPEPEAGELRGGQAAVAAEGDDRVTQRRTPFRLGRRLDADEGKLALLETQLAKAKRAAPSRSSRKRRRP